VLGGCIESHCVYFAAVFAAANTYIPTATCCIACPQRFPAFEVDTVDLSLEEHRWDEAGNTIKPRNYKSIEFCGIRPWHQPHLGYGRVVAKGLLLVRVHHAASSRPHN
jgi:hypothetical protein